jgi:hypothetical protein
MTPQQPPQVGNGANSGKNHLWFLEDESETIATVHLFWISGRGVLVLEGETRF